MRAAGPVARWATKPAEQGAQAYLLAGDQVGAAARDRGDRLEACGDVAASCFAQATYGCLKKSSGCRLGIATAIPLEQSGRDVPAP